MLKRKKKTSLMYLRSPILNASDLFLKKAKKKLKWGKIFVACSAISLVLKLVLVVAKKGNFAFVQNLPMYTIGNQVVSTCTLLSAGLGAIALALAVCGVSKLCRAYKFLYERSEYCRQAPFMTTSV